MRQSVTRLNGGAPLERGVCWRVSPVMQIAPRLALAAAVIALGGATGGAVIGAQIGETGIIRHASVGGERPQYDFQADYDRPNLARTDERPPDHYAIETPEGHFEVGELRERGLYRNRRYSAYDAALAAEDRAWEQDMAALSSDDWQPDPRFADREWRRAGGNAYESREYGVTVIRNTPDNTRLVATPKAGGMEDPAPAAQLPVNEPAPRAIGPQEVQPLDLPVPVTLPPPSQ
jgi:hypothetical protein